MLHGGRSMPVHLKGNSAEQGLTKPEICCSLGMFLLSDCLTQHLGDEDLFTHRWTCRFLCENFTPKMVPLWLKTGRWDAGWRRVSQDLLAKSIIS